MLFANNDAGDVIQFDPATGLAKVAYANINTAGAVSRAAGRLEHRNPPGDGLVVRRRGTGRVAP